MKFGLNMKKPVVIWSLIALFGNQSLISPALAQSTSANPPINLMDLQLSESDSQPTGGSRALPPAPAASPAPAPAPSPAPMRSAPMKGLSVDTSNQSEKKAQNIPIAQVASEFYCPLFNTEPFESINSSLRELQDVFAEVQSCEVQKKKDQEASIGNQLKDISGLFESLKSQKDVLNSLTATMDGNPKDIEALGQTVKGIVGKIKTVQARLRSKGSMAELCIDSKTQKEKIIFGLNNMIHDLAPVALKLIAKNPELAELAPVVFGVTAGSNAIAGLIESSNENCEQDSQLDPDKKNSSQNLKLEEMLRYEENRRAIVQNACNFMRVYKSINFLQTTSDPKLRDSRMKDLNLGLKQDLSALETSGVKNAPRWVQERNANIENWMQTFQRVQNQNTEFQTVLGNHEKRLQGSDATGNESCAVLRLYTSNQKPNEFPNVIVTNLNWLKTNFGDDGSVKTLTDTFDSFRQEAFQILKATGPGHNNSSACVKTAQNWIKSLRSSSDYLKSGLKKARKEMERTLSADSQVAQYSKAKKEMDEVSINKEFLQKILEDMDKNSAIASYMQMTDLGTRKNTGVLALLGKDNSGFRCQKRPVFRWLQYYRNILDVRVGVLKGILNELVVLQAPMATMKMYAGDKEPRGFLEREKIYSQRREDLEKYTYITPNYIHSPGGTRKACEKMDVAVSRYFQVVHAFAAVHLMCDMVSPALAEPGVDKELVAFCSDRSLDGKSSHEAEYRSYMREIKTLKKKTNVLKAKQEAMNCSQFD